MAIIRKDAYYLSSTGINKIHCRIWQDDEKEPKAVFQIAHGVSEHIERYDEFARFLANEGYIVCGNDHLGHGKIRALLTANAAKMTVRVPRHGGQGQNKLALFGHLQFSLCFLQMCSAQAAA